jgi:hypothetical protein
MSSIHARFDPSASEAIAVFAKDLGDWDAEVEVRPGPGAPPLAQRGVSTNRLVGGKWLVIDYRADSGFEGHGIYGWDASKGKYTGAWVDTMQTCIARSEGTWDPATRTMTYLTEATHGGGTIRYRELTQTVEDGVLLYRNLVPMPDGGEFEMIRTVYRRR